MGFSIREIESTPNPNAMKFVLDQPISAKPISIADASQAELHPIAASLFKVDGVVRLLLLNDFVTVNKAPSTKWSAIKPKVVAILKKADPHANPNL